MDNIHELQHLFLSQKLSVLATQSGGQPHSCLVAFAASKDLKHIIFATNRNTKKYRDIHASPRVAMLVDNRENTEFDFQKAIAITVKGTAREVTGTERNVWLSLYIEKHPNLQRFTDEADVALVLIAAEEYLIAKFDSTSIFKPS